jgi:rhodanese-related sulfurtransferase
MASSVKDMLAAANSAVPRIQPADLREQDEQGDVVVVDVRDAPELATGGKIKGAVHVPRGMLEFRADAESPYHNPALRKEKTVVPLLRIRRARGTRRKNAARAWLQVGLQCGRLQGFGGSGSGDRASLEALDPPKRSANCLHVPCVRENWRAPNHRG